MRAHGRSMSSPNSITDLTGLGIGDQVSRGVTVLESESIGCWNNGELLLLKPAFDRALTLLEVGR